MDKPNFRFSVGDTVWVRDRCHKAFDARSCGGYTIVEATVREQHSHPGRHPAYLNGEGYALDGDLWWDCYPSCRVFATRNEAVAARLAKTAPVRVLNATKLSQELSAS